MAVHVCEAAHSGRHADAAGFRGAYMVTEAHLGVRVAFGPDELPEVAGPR